jgi:phosphotransferase system enzyme I (PtsI)
MTPSTRDRSSQELSGVGLSPGISIGTAYEVEPQTAAFYPIRIADDEVTSELKRLRAGLKESRRQLEKAKEKLEAELGKEHSQIIDAHLLILEDPLLLREIEKNIQEELQSPERAVREAAENWISVYRSLEDPFFRERGSDVEEVIQRLISNLMELHSHGQEGLPEDLILVASEASLFLLVEYPLERVKGLVVKKGGTTSHGIIIARSYQIPVVAGIQDLKEVIRTGDTLIVDGTSGMVRVQPSEEEIRSYQARVRKEQKLQQELVGDTSPCLTSDDQRIFLYANAEIDSEVPLGLRLGGGGIGLFRSEYIYMKEKQKPVSEEQQFQIYKNLATVVGNRPAFIRTLDFGGETHPYFTPILGETDTALGLRGIRLSLRHPEIYREQIRAILRGSAYGNLKIVLPMVSDVDEVVQASRLIQAAKEELLGEGVAFNEEIEVGIMVEVPAAVIMLEALCPHVDFFAVGTNDLVQYTLAVSRTDDRIANLFKPLHPAVLKSLYRVAQVAAAEGVLALVCGEVASHPVYACLLIGMGFRHLSMSPFAIPEVKGRLREISSLEAGDMVEDVLRQATLEEVEDYVNEFMKKQKTGVTS